MPCKYVSHASSLRWSRQDLWEKVGILRWREDFYSAEVSSRLIHLPMITIHARSWMWFIRRSRSSSIYVFIALTVLFIASYVLFYDKTLVSGGSSALINDTSGKKNHSEKYLQVHLDLTTSTARCRSDDYLIIYVLSTVSNIERRKVIRSTWASKRNGTCFVFVVGQPSGMFSGAGMVQRQILGEQKEYQDIVEIDHLESYANVVYKELAALLWSHRFYRHIPYLFKTDDDLLVDTILLSSIAQLLVTNVSKNTSFLARNRPPLVTTLMSSDRVNFFRGGWAMDYQPTVRDRGKFGVSYEVWPHPVLPAYCSGFGWMMSRFIRDQLVQASYTYPVRKAAWIGDVFVSGFLAKAGNVKCTGMAIDYDQTASANCSCLMVNNPMLTVCSSTFHAGGGGTENEKYIEYQRAWGVIQLRHNSTQAFIDNC